MSNAKLGTIAWVAIYLGMALVGLGIALQRGDAGFGWGVTTVGALGVVAGAVLVWLRSRVEDGS